jgi:hypothetical protein
VLGRQPDHPSAGARIVVDQVISQCRPRGAPDTCALIDHVRRVGFVDTTPGVPSSRRNRPGIA